MGVLPVTSYFCTLSTTNLSACSSNEDLLVKYSPLVRFAYSIYMFIYGFYYHFSNLRFKQTQTINDISAAHIVICVVSSEILKCRLVI